VGKGRGLEELVMIVGNGVGIPVVGNGEGRRDGNGRGLAELAVIVGNGVGSDAGTGTG